MGKTVITKNATAQGDIGAVFDVLKKNVEAVGFEEISTIWPTELEFKRGKGGMFATKIKDVKTVLKISLVQAAANVNLLFEYTLGVPSSFMDKNDNHIEDEFRKLKHGLSGIAAPQEDKICDVCLTPILRGENFCRSCGRSSQRNLTQTAGQNPSELDVTFDQSKIAFGFKELDDSLYGGIPGNSIVLITSPACEEKDLILTRFMETGLDDSGIIVYVSSDLKTGQNKLESTEFYQVVCNSQAEVRRTSGDGANTQNCVKISGVERLNELSLALTNLLNTISKNEDYKEKPRRLVIDILSDMLLSNQSVNTRKWLRETFTKFKIENFTILAVLNPFMHSKEETQALLDLFDGQIDIYEKEAQGLSRMFMRVKRMSNSRFGSKETVLIRDTLWSGN